MKRETKLLMMCISSLLFVGCATPKENKIYNEGVNIIPTPNSMVMNEGVFALTPSTDFIIVGADAKEVATYFISKINSSTGYNLSSSEGNTVKKIKSNTINITVDATLEMNDEGYSLDVATDNVAITAKTSTGAFYAMQSFMQLLPAEIESQSVVKDIKWNAPAVTIKDSPRFQYRGLMMDVTRHFFDVEQVKRHLDVLSMFKINTLHWHLTEDQLWTVQIDKYPDLTTIGANRKEGDGTYHKGFYTKEQLKEVVAHATSLHIEVIPEIEMPGHALAALAAYPEFSCTGGPFEIRNVWGVEADVYCAGKEATFGFLEDVLEEIIPIFPSEYIHIGGDECPKDRWKECPDCKARMKKEGLKDTYELQSYFIKRMEKFINSKGKKIIGWDEILEGGIAPNATIMSWRGEKGGVESANKGHNVIMSPNSHMYIDHYQGAAGVEPPAIGGYLPLEKCYSYDPIPKDIAADKAHHVLGVQANMWAEYLYTYKQQEYMIYPRIIAVAEVGWTDLDKKDFTDFSRRISNAYVRLDMHDMNYHIPMPEGGIADYIAFTDNTTLELSNTRNLPMVYTIDGSTPTATSTIYSAPITASVNTTVKVATLLPSHKLSTIRTIKLAKETLSPAYTGETKEGITVSKAEGYHADRAAYSNAKFGEAVVSKYFDKSADYKKPSVEIYEGYIDVAEDGVYTFICEQSELYIDDVLVVDNDNKSGRNKRSASSKALAKGKHKFKMVMNNIIFDGFPNSWYATTFYIQSPSETKVSKVTAEALSH